MVKKSQVQVMFAQEDDPSAERAGFAEQWSHWFASLKQDVHSTSLPLSDDSSHLTYLLRIDDQGLSLLSGPGIANRTPLHVSFVSAQMRHRQKTLGKRQPLARAVGVRPGLKVLDATFGLGKDGFFLATLGCSVLGIERSPLVYALVADGLRRLQEQERAEGGAATDLAVLYGDAQTYLPDLGDADRPQVIYLDPMYPERRKSALPKKELQWLRQLIGLTPDQDFDLLGLALTKARERVVVKRPLDAPPLGDDVWLSYKGGTTRYDVYRPRRLGQPR